MKCVSCYPTLKELAIAADAAVFSPELASNIVGDILSEAIVLVRIESQLLYLPGGIAGET